jgi:hypothetical protein
MIGEDRVDHESKHAEDYRTTNFTQLEFAGEMRQGGLQREKHCHNESRSHRRVMVALPHQRTQEKRNNDGC